MGPAFIVMHDVNCSSAITSHCLLIQQQYAVKHTMIQSKTQSNTQNTRTVYTDKYTIKLTVNHTVTDMTEIQSHGVVVFNLVLVGGERGEGGYT